ncbi:MBL fold metallo-hydrolase [Qipengyuania pelagi]|jgi:glyoxylase-like metal-dependent hydrolase (beta-lactamase superfamily II)|uniref:MBL fold metallo-hydrolase n=1 Tax=Qipengyuania pelagi TaxID=994320 RepID=A0A844Y7W3_9SPHN|nr:MBL fold metallo-hydrolase [Qipengyuania pelagi]MXO53092.1 MBL fold metallo-hydrolase [Qipengyuania pelagi]
MSQPVIEAFFDEPTNTISYLVGDPATHIAAVIDPVLDFDLASGEADTRSAERILAFAKDKGWEIAMVLETHAHADHLSAAPFIKAQTGASIGIGAHIRDVQKIFRPVFAMDDLAVDGSDFDRLFEDGERFRIGELEVEVMHVPGHTPADVAYLVADAAFVGDTLFMPDYGTARADFPGGDARTLYRSIRRLLELPDETRLFLCHDYKAPGRDEYRWETTVGEQKRSSIHIHEGMSEDDFVAMREERDAGLSVPKLLLPSIQVNIRAGRFEEAEANGVTYLRIPVKWNSDNSA